MDLSAYYSTGVPEPFECVYAVEVKNKDEVETLLHRAFVKDLYADNREFFKIDALSAMSALKLTGG